MRKPLIAGNWKMHGSTEQVATLVNGILQGMNACEDTDVLVLPTFLHIAQVAKLTAGTALLLGAQNLYLGASGAFTGEVSGTMLREMGCQYVLVGHSERRSIFKEDLNTIAAKFQAAIAAGLKPILCIGETREEREQGKTDQVLHEQLSSVISAAGIDAFQHAVIAYEPVWAIGTGLTATPEQAQAAHAYIRNEIRQNKVDLGGAIRILYGGSMKAENAASLLAMPDIDGGLIGGAALDAGSFLKICEASRLECTK